MKAEGPTRVWRRRVKGWRMPENTVSVCRPGPWGNPFAVGSDYTQEEAVAEFKRAYLEGFPDSEVIRRIGWMRRNIGLLRGKNLACFCKPGTPCHADVLLEMANATTTEEP